MKKYRELSVSEYELVTEGNVEIPMRDGTILRADITRPSDPGKFPVILQRTPYNKQAGFEGGKGIPEFYGTRGFVVVVQDVRGRFGSDGDFYPYRDDGAGINQDGYDTVEWLAKQPWSNGKVGTFGGSYTGSTQYLNAISRPPHLKTMFVREAPAEYYQEHIYRGGAFELGSMMGFSRFVTLANISKLVKEEDVPRHKEILESADANAEYWYEQLPLFPTPYLVGLSDWYNDWLDNPIDGPYWDAFNIQKKHDQIEVPAYHLGGWFDVFLMGTLKNYTGIKTQGGTETARSNQRLIIGPWEHGPLNVENQFAGEYDFGRKAPLKIDDLQLPWFDQWLKGKDTGILDDPPVRIFVMGRNEWTNHSEWPIPGTKYSNFYLHDGEGGSSTSLNDGVLSTNLPRTDEAPDTYVYDPSHPVPSVGGNTIMLRMASTPNKIGNVRLPLGGGAFDQRETERRCLTYTSAILEEEIEVTGLVKAVLYGESSALDTDWIVRLTDVHPDGYSRPVADGILRARYRESFKKPSLLRPGEIYKYIVDLWATSNAFLPGHRVRVAITSSCFPRFDRNLNTGGSIHRESEGVVATNTIHHDRLRPSHIILPVVPQKS